MGIFDSERQSHWTDSTDFSASDVSHTHTDLKIIEMIIATITVQEQFAQEQKTNNVRQTMELTDILVTLINKEGDVRANAPKREMSEPTCSKEGDVRANLP